MEDKPRYRVYRPNAMFNTLRRLHGQNLESQGLNNLTEAFQSFMTRARYLTVGNLRRTWSHGAVEFMKYRRLLPMLVSDEHDLGSAFDNFDLSDRAKFLSSTGKNDERKITVSNVSNRVTASQLQSFFSKFGKVQSCHFPTEDRRQSMYATLPKQSKKALTVNIMFKDEESASRAKNASPQELKFYGQTMLISNYVSSRRRTTSNQTSTENQLAGLAFGIAPRQVDDGKLSRSSSVLSISSTGTPSSQVLPLDELPPRVLESIFKNLGPIDKIRLEITNKTWLEASAKAWSSCKHLSFSKDEDLNSFFTSTNPLRNSHLSAFLLRCAINLRSLDISNTNNFLDDKAIEQIGQLCTNLEDLDISGVHASPDSLHSLTESLPNLKRIAYREMHTSDERCFWYLFKNPGKSLTHVDFRGSNRFKGRCFKSFGIELEEILLDGCASIKDDVIEEICNRCKNVQVLCLNGCYRLTNQSISLISRHLTQLTTFSLAGEHFSITSEALLSISRLQKLTRLELDFNPAVNSEFIESISNNLHSLQSLSLAFSGSDSTIDPKGLESLGQLNELRELDLSGLASVTNDVLIAICNGCAKLTKLTARSCIYLGDEGIKSLDKLQNLETVDISGCLLVTSSAIQHLINTFSIQKQPDGHSITLCIGGTVCEAHMVRCRNTRINLDMDDYSTTNLGNVKKFIELLGVQEGAENDETMSDDGFGILSAHRSFVADALTVDDDPIDNDNDNSWAIAEAQKMGLLDTKK